MTVIARVEASDRTSAEVAIRRDGIVVVEGMWAAAAIDAVHLVVREQQPEFDNPDRLQDFQGDKTDRFIAPVLITRELRATGLFDNADLLALCAAMLGEDFVFEAFGMLMGVRGGA